MADVVDGVLFFAGEATDQSSFMTAHAAMNTGQRAARQVMYWVGNFLQLERDWLVGIE